LPEADLQRLRAFAQASGYVLYLQPGGTDTVHPLAEEAQLSFPIPEFDLRLQFRPLDFIQVNAGLNQKMIADALQLLDAQSGDRVLDLFCGLGNFTLPLARGVREVVGVEGDAGLVQRARDNARHNGIDNAQFHAADLAQDLRAQPWMREGFDRLLLDPPRSGADVVLRQLPLKGLKRIVYVSCHPASLARDAGYLVNERGWKLRAAGVMDMFPHTAHVESIAMFELSYRNNVPRGLRSGPRRGCREMTSNPICATIRHPAFRGLPCSSSASPAPHSTRRSASGCSTTPAPA
jgi:23S rRNA (uracil1939-C5)-methyltransferase